MRKLEVIRDVGQVDRFQYCVNATMNVKNVISTKYQAFYDPQINQTVYLCFIEYEL